MVFFKKNFEDSLLSKNHCKVRSKPDVSLLSASREKPAPPLTHTSGLIVSMCARTSRFQRRDSVFFVVVSAGGNFQDRPILPEVHDFSDLSVGSLVKFGFAALGPFSRGRSHIYKNVHLGICPCGNLPNLAQFIIGLQAGPNLAPHL